MHTVTGMPKSRPWWARAKAWFPALAAMTPFAFRSSGSNRRALRAPLSLKLPVRCRYSNLQKTWQPNNSLSHADSLQGVRITPDSIRLRAATICSNVTGMLRILLQGRLQLEDLDSLHRLSTLSDTRLGWRLGGNKASGVGQEPTVGKDLDAGAVQVNVDIQIVGIAKQLEGLVPDFDGQLCGDVPDEVFSDLDLGILF